MLIVPAVLAEKREDFLLRLRQAESFAGYVQIDFMDGSFVPTKSIPPEDISEAKTPLSFELHLMARDPGAVMEKVHNPALKKVLFHVESRVDHLEFIAAMKDRGIQPGLAIKPDTPLDSCQDAAAAAGALLFLTVDPGSYGSPFRPEVLKKVSEARRIYPDKTIAVDGGLSLDNLKEVFDIGVDSACVGSRIFLRGDPAENYRTFLARLQEFEEARDREKI